LGELTAALGEVNREMYRQAAKLKLLWPSLKRDALEAMVEYMNSLRRSEFVAGTTK
jgi:hypothetical protein